MIQAEVFACLKLSAQNGLYVYAMGLEPWLEFLLGLAYTPDATQIKEAQRFLSLAREAGFVEARLVKSSCDIYFDSLPVIDFLGTKSLGA